MQLEHSDSLTPLTLPKNSKASLNLEENRHKKLTLELTKKIESKRFQNNPSTEATPKKRENLNHSITKRDFLEKLKSLPETPLKEQIQDVLLLFEIKKKQKKIDSKNQILTFCFNLLKQPIKEPNKKLLPKNLNVKSTKDRHFSAPVGIKEYSKIYKSSESLTISELRTTIGKLIYLMNVNIAHLDKSLNDKNEEDQIKEIDRAFESELTKINHSLAKFAKNHQKGMLQDKERALSTKIPILLANALISDSGYVNIGIIEPLMSRFLSPKRKLPFEKNIAYALNRIKNFTLLRRKIHLITAPFSQNYPINHLIKITLGLDEFTLTTAIHAKKTALAALISHMRQSPASSCFASFIAISKLSEDLGACLDDFCELLQKSELSRNVGEEQKEFSFLMRTGKESVSQKIRIDNEGNIQGENNKRCFLAEVPGIISACNILGVKNRKRTFLYITKELFKEYAGKEETQNLLLISVSKILKWLAKEAPGDFQTNYALAKLSYESELHNPLLRIWENVIASMAEARESSKIRESFVLAVTQVLSKILGHDPLFKQTITKKIKDRLLQLIQFSYDTDMKSHKIALDGRSERGAFVLYNKLDSSLPSEWQPVQTAEDFRSFILSVVRQSFSLTNDKQELLKEIKQFILTDKFLIEILKQYHPDNQNISDEILIKNREKLSHTPWKDKTKNNSIEVLQIYSDRMKPARLTLNPRNAKRLLVSLIDLGRKMGDKEKKELIISPLTFTPVVIQSVHAFSMMFGHETLMKAIQSKIAIEEWIFENMIKPGKAISDSKISELERENLINLVYHHAIPKKDSNSLDKFIQCTKSISPNLTLSQFRHELFNTIKNNYSKREINLKTLVNGIDFFIYKYILDENKQKQLGYLTIHFADTNWHAGLNDIHFCFVFNPGNEKIEMWEIYDNGEGLYPLPQEDWIMRKTWIIY